MKKLFIPIVTFISVSAQAQLSTIPISAVSFPKEVIPVNAGKIDFWAKLTGFSGAIPVGGVAPYFFMISDGISTFHTGFNSNDGQGNGGLTGLAGNAFFTATGFFNSGSYTYEDLLGDAGGWHHYVFQWNKDGIPGVDNGQQKVAIFIDDVLNSSRWRNSGLGLFQAFTSCPTFNLITLGNPGPIAGRVAIDEIKIFDGSNNLVLWNTLGSSSEITNSSVGLNGSYNGTGNPQFVAGISGNAIQATPVYTLSNANCAANTLVTVNTSPAGRSFSVDGITSTSEQYFFWVGGSSHTIATTSPQAGTPGTNYVFTNWSDAGRISHSITPTSPTTYTANFNTVLGGICDFRNRNWGWIHGDSFTQSLGNYGQQGVASPANKPRATHLAMTCTDAQGNLWMFGGAGFVPSTVTQIYLNDLWKYEPATNQWTWMRGTDNAGSFNSPGKYSGPDAIPGARISGVMWPDNNGNLWLFGGNGYGEATNGGYLNDVWKFNIASNTWTWISGAKTVNAPAVYGPIDASSSSYTPGARYFCYSWKDASANIWILGGENSPNGYLNDLWKYNIVTNEWTWVKGDNIGSQTGTYGTKGTPDIMNKPGAREAGVSWIDGNKLWLFGGYGFASGPLGFGRLNDVWVYDIQTKEWTWVHGENTTDQPGSYGTLGVPDPSNTPGARFSGVGWKDGCGSLLLFGGRPLDDGALYNFSNDLWEFNTLTSEWTWIKGDEAENQYGIYGPLGRYGPINKPGARSDHMAWTGADNTLWLFGGFGYATNFSTAPSFLNDLWNLGGFNKWYVDDNSNTDDRWTGINAPAGNASAGSVSGGSAPGNDATGDGTINNPFRTINKAVSMAISGDEIYVDAGTYTEYVHVNKSLKFYGANKDISPNPTVPRAGGYGETIVISPATSGVKDEGAGTFYAHQSGTKIEINGFQIRNGRPLSDAHELRNAANPQNIEILFTKNWVSNGSNLFAGTLTKWLNLTVTDNYFNNITRVPTSSAIQVYDASGLPATLTAVITDNRINTTNVSGILLHNVANATVLRNVIRQTPEAGIQLSGGMGASTIAQNDLQNTNTLSQVNNGGLRVEDATFVGPITITNNAVRLSRNGFAIKAGNITGKNIHVNNNSFNNSNTLSIYHGGTGTLDGECNYNGANTSATITPRIFGPVDFTPYIPTQTDTDPVTPGFQGNACTGVARAEFAGPKDQEGIMRATGLTVTVSPNPASTNFNLKIESPNDEPVTVNVVDISGRLVSVYSKVSANGTLSFGKNLKTGTYFVQVSQGADRKVIELVKID